ncbi:hypothetical protein BH11PAT4_BH11PAT4_2040 [soil metagenome]
MQLTRDDMKGLIVAAKTVTEDTRLTQPVWESAVTAISRGIADLDGVENKQCTMLSCAMRRLQGCWNEGKLNVERAHGALDGVLVWLFDTKADHKDLDGARSTISDMFLRLCPPTA